MRKVVAIVALIAASLAGCGGAAPSTRSALTHPPAPAPPRATEPTGGAASRAAPVREQVADLYRMLRAVMHGDAADSQSAKSRLAEVSYGDDDVELARRSCATAVLTPDAQRRSERACMSLLMTLARRSGVMPDPGPQPVERRIEGELTDGDAILDHDDSLYDDYEVELIEGWTIEVDMQSEQFDTYIWLIDPAGESVIQVDDIGTPGRGDTNSYYRLRVPTTGRYVVRANAYDRAGRGTYRLSVRAGPMPILP